MKKTVALFKNTRFGYVSVFSADMSQPDLIRVSEPVEVEFEMLDIDADALTRAAIEHRRAELAEEMAKLDKSLSRLEERS